MKNKIKLTALILSLTTLFGCAENNLTSSGESSLQNSEVSSSDATSSVSESTTSTENTESVDENWIKGDEDCEIFSFDRDSFSFTNAHYEMDKDYDPHGFSPYAGSATLEEYTLERRRGVFIKGRIAGDSYNAFYTGYSQLFFDNSDTSKSGKITEVKTFYPPCYPIVLTPIVVEEIVDDGLYGTSLKVGDIVYVTENYYVMSENVIKVIEAEKKSVLDSLALPGREETAQSVESEFNNTIDLHNQLLSRHNDELAMGEISYPMEKDKSYLLFVNEKHSYKEIDKQDVKICEMYLNFNLSDDAPTSYGEKMDGRMNRYKRYIDFWEQAKELYGSHFE